MQKNTRHPPFPTEDAGAAKNGVRLTASISLAANSSMRKRGIKITSEQRSGSNRFGGNVYWVDYTLAPMKEQAQQVQKMITNFKSQYKVV